MEGTKLILINLASDYSKAGLGDIRGNPGLWHRPGMNDFALNNDQGLMNMFKMDNF